LVAVRHKFGRSFTLRRTPLVLEIRMSPLITIQKLLVILLLSALVVAAATSLVPTASNRFVQEAQTQTFFIMATFAFALTPALVDRKESATSRSMAVLSVANLIIAASLVIGWQIAVSNLQRPTIEASMTYLLFLIGYFILWRYAAIDILDQKLRRCMELAIPAGLASFCFQGWLLPWQKNFFAGTGWLTPLIFYTFLATTTIYIIFWCRHTEAATLTSEIRN
ncbi:hypothetical protein N9Y42_00005, partial [Mariniblastus sp.]|nr:hypothetical protein [Mariniblastus sp.]